MNIKRIALLRSRPQAGGAIAWALAVLALAAPPHAVAQAAASVPTSALAKPAKPAQQQPSFASPEAGFDALIAALRAADAKQLSRLLGPGHQRIIDSGDSAADRETWARFIAGYDAKHAIQLEGDAKAVLVTGPDDWPMPIPLVKRANGWVLDSDAGEEEIITRRIGRNELDTIQTCLAFVDMQREYAEADRNGDGVLEYAARVISSKGKRDGLYWPTAAGDPLSPAGPLLGAAVAGSRQAGAGRGPYHGYYYRVLTAQGKNAPGGARSYYANGKLIGGVALIAYPASYLDSGVKTFMCNMDGIVHEKDLGTGTSSAAARITAYDPDPGWVRSK